MSAPSSGWQLSARPSAEELLWRSLRLEMLRSKRVRKRMIRSVSSCKRRDLSYHQQTNKHQTESDALLTLFRRSRHEPACQFVIERVYFFPFWIPLVVVSFSTLHTCAWTLPLIQRVVLLLLQGLSNRQCLYWLSSRSMSSATCLASDCAIEFKIPEIIAFFLILRRR